MVELVCLEVQKAFDSVCRLVLIRELKPKELEVSLLKWINSSLLQRKLYKINSAISKVCTKDGVPQGSVKFPILLLIYVSRSILKTKAQISQFADSFALNYKLGSNK